MQNRTGSTKVVFAPDFFIIAAASLLLIPLRWLFFWVCAAAFHEMCHYVALRVCGSRVFSIRMGAGGAIMRTEPLTIKKECICAAAGPAGGILLLLLAPKLPMLAVCAFVQSVFNLLPLFPLDGGRVLACLIRIVFSEKHAVKILKITQILVMAVVICLGLYACVKLLLGPLPVAAAMLLVFRNKNLLAKRQGNEYNMGN